MGKRPVVIDSDKLDGGKPTNMHRLDFNCYEYASGQIRIDGHTPRVGHMGGKPLESGKYSLRESMMADGFIPAKATDMHCGQPQSKKGYDMVAAYITYNRDGAIIDAHFLRKGDNGKWQHKFGVFGEITDRDSKNKIITDPAKANVNGLVKEFGFFTRTVTHNKFEGYYYVPKDGLKTGPDNDIGKLVPPDVRAKIQQLDAPINAQRR